MTPSAEPAAVPPAVSVIVTTHNRPDMLAEALDSVIGQDWESWECIVVDDGSEPPVVLDSEDRRFRLIRREEPGGPSAARNAGLEAASEDFIAFLDDDDVMAPWRIRVGMEALEANPEATCHLGVVVREPDPKFGSIPRKAAEYSREALRSRTPQVGRLLLRRESVLGFDEALQTSEDVDWWLRTAPLANLVITDDVVGSIRLHDEIRTRAVPEVRFQDRLRTYVKNRHLMPAFGEGRSRHLRRVAEAALAAGHRVPAARYAFLALLTNPDRRKLGILARSFGMAPKS